MKSLADETRLTCTLLIASEGELCVCELVEALGVSQPKVSRHLAQLRTQGLLSDRRQEQWIFYRLNPELPGWANEIVETAARAESAKLEKPRKQLHAMKGRPSRCS